MSPGGLPADQRGAAERLQPLRHLLLVLVGHRGDRNAGLFGASSCQSSFICSEFDFSWLQLSRLQGRLERRR